MGWEDSLLPWAEGKLRLELCLRTEELKGRGTLDETVLWEYFDRVQGGIMPEKVARELGVTSPDVSSAALSTFLRWERGEDVRHSMDSTKERRKFYRHRLAILEACGIDISLPYHVDEVEQEVFDLAYLKAHQCPEVPEGLQGYMFDIEKGPAWSTR